MKKLSEDEQIFIEELIKTCRKYLVIKPLTQVYEKVLEEYGSKYNSPEIGGIQTDKPPEEGQGDH